LGLWFGFVVVGLGLWFGFVIGWDWFVAGFDLKTEE